MTIAGASRSCSSCPVGLSWLCHYRARQPGPVSKVAPTGKLGIAVAIVSRIVFPGESPGRPVAIGGGPIVLDSIVLALS